MSLSIVRAFRLIARRLEQLLLAACLALVVNQRAPAQDVFHHAYGDSTVREVVRGRVGPIYDQKGTWVFLLSRVEQVGREVPTEARGKLVDGQLQQIVVTEWRPHGKYSAEYYMDLDQLLFVYETFEYFEESHPATVWRNFKGLPAWERRSYFDGPVIGYAEVSGGGEVVPGDGADTLKKNAERLRALLREAASIN